MEVACDVGLANASHRDSAQVIGVGYMHLSGKQGGSVRALALAVVAAVSLSGCSSLKPKGDWRLVWEENFNGPELNRAQWYVEHTTPTNPGLEEDDFADHPDHVRIENGNLILSAIRKEDGRYLTGLVNTRARTAWMHGRFEARIKVPRGAGAAPQFWMMPDVPSFERWPISGEIDIMENLGREPLLVHGTIHYEHTNRHRDHGVYRSPHPLSDDFHVYAVEWDRNSFAWSVDGQVFHRTSDPNMARFPFNRRFFVILSMGAGGKWAGPINAETPMPIQMEVDWVRVYQRKGRENARGSAVPQQ